MLNVLITPESLLHKQGPHTEILQAAGFDVVYPNDSHLTRGLGTEEKTIDELQGAAALIAGGEHLTGRVLNAVPSLRVIARCGVGYDRVDIDAATAKGIPVTITPTANHEAVAELALALMFAVAKSVVANDADTRLGRWNQKPTRPIRRSTLGILGLGRIGRSLAARAISLRMQVIATETYPDERFVREHNIELVDFESLLARSDYLSVHCPLNDETRGLLNKDVFATMKPGSALINTARGDLVVEADLIEALKSGHLRAAGLDVFEQEPVAADNPLFQLDNVVCSPHIAGADELSMEDMGIEAAQCIVKLSKGEWPDGAVVNESLKDSWNW